MTSQVTSFDANRDEPTPEEVLSLKKAPLATLEAKAKGHCPEELMQRLVTDLTAWETASGTRKNIRRNGLEKLRAAVAAFVADLLHARNHPEAKGWVYRSLSKESFSRHAVSFRDFKSIVKTWTARGLLGAQTRLHADHRVRSRRNCSDTGQGFPFPRETRAVASVC